MSTAEQARAEEQALLKLATDGDERAFGELVDAYRSELRACCYRMLGSVQDAEDALQEALLRAWRGLPGFEGRSSVRSWLYSIATNTALDITRRRSRRELPVHFGPAAQLGADLDTPLTESAWLEPYPDRWLTGDPGHSPEVRYEQRESVELAFIIALQRLPPLQRAVLILRDVVGFSAAETASQLSTSVPAANSALQRARATIASAGPARTQAATLRVLGDQRIKTLAARYADAMERGDADTLVSMLTADVTWSMPPIPTWFSGHRAVRAFLTRYPLTERWKHQPTAANGQLAIGCYLFDADLGRYLPAVIDVLTLEGDRIAAVTGFLVGLNERGGAPISTEIFARFGLPAEPGPWPAQ
jgi:RNA polymerase sigma-70 factor (ECF subfamily)